MRNAFTFRLLAALVLGLWMTPSLSALGVGLHLVLDHHEHKHGQHHGHGAAGHSAAVPPAEGEGTGAGDAAFDWSALVQALVHGHHHPELTPDHGHEIIAQAPSRVPRPVSTPLAYLPGAPCPEQVGPGTSATSLPPSHPPPAPLFTFHCALLL